MNSYTVRYNLPYDSADRPKRNATIHADTIIQARLKFRRLVRNAEQVTITKGK